MPSAYSDSFTDVNGTLLQDHVPDSPTAFTYTKHDANDMTIQNGRVGNDTVGSPTLAKYTADVDPHDPDSGLDFFEVVIQVAASGGIDACTNCGGVIYLLSDPVDFDGYSFGWSGNSSTQWAIQISRVTNEAHVSLWNSGLISRLSAGTHVLRLERNGSGNLFAKIDGVTQNTSVNDTTHGPMVAVGLCCKSNSGNDLAILSFQSGEELTPPTADFSHTTDFLEASFTDESTEGAGTITAWDWDFGDGSPHGTTQNPTHEYAVQGTYTVVLTITDEHGSTDDVSHDVLVFEPIPEEDPNAPNYLPILHVDSFESTFGQQIGLRMKARRWERYNGREWRVIPGTVAGQRKQRLYTAAIDGRIVAANGSSRLLAWNGHPDEPVEILSNEAPRAYFVTRIGNRLLAAKIRSSSSLLDFNPDEVAYSADGDIEEWTDSLAGAGRLLVAPEGKSPGSNYISGLSTLERGAVLYRQRSLVLVSRTGVRAAPFRFQTVDFSHGTESPYSIANGGLALGDFFLGYDYVVYHFDGASPPVPIGLPIQRRLEQRITDLADCVGFIDPVRMEYWLLVPTQLDNQPVLDEAYIFSIRDYIRKQKLSWRVSDLTLTNTDTDLVSAGGYPQRVPTNYVPVVDEYDDPVDDIVDDQDWLVDSLVQRHTGMVMLGTMEGNTYRYNLDMLQMDGYWLSKQFGQEHDLITLDRVRLVATASEVCYVGVSVTWDGGQTYTDEVPIRIDPSNEGSFSASGWQITTGHLFQLKLRMINGDCIVHKVNVYAQPRGRAA